MEIKILNPDNLDVIFNVASHLYDQPVTLKFGTTNLCIFDDDCGKIFYRDFNLVLGDLPAIILPSQIFPTFDEIVLETSNLVLGKDLVIQCLSTCTKFSINEPYISGKLTFSFDSEDEDYFVYKTDES